MQILWSATPPAPPSRTPGRAIPVRKLSLLSVAVAVGLAAHHDPELTSQVLLGLVTFTALDRLDASIR
ncbi:hypothetical protein [Micromonospora sp. WMMD812]|uniref:hypothetical protein n=1 Tax=Micromonospora sp. WMMD812 TaxID=3015152 RepID=UPI00248D02A5|nr:hypothetical protein [Micromonospora sp. WMMD812]WBB69941.1 hypothetical protein O7603_11530 [Micromonospora sp. WMMD812]